MNNKHVQASFFEAHHRRTLGVKNCLKKKIFFLGKIFLNIGLLPRYHGITPTGTSTQKWVGYTRPGRAPFPSTMALYYGAF